MARHPGPILLLLVAASSLIARADDSRPPRYEQIVGEFDRAMDAASRVARDNDARPEAARQPFKFPRPKDYAPRLLALAEAEPTDPTARQALLWILGHNVDLGFDAQYAPLVARAADLVVQYHRDDEAVGPVLLGLTDCPSPPRDSFLRAIFERTANPTNRGRACFALAQYLKVKGNLVQQIRTPGYQPEDPGWTNKLYGTAYYASLAEVDPDPLLAEAERLYERVLAEYAAIDHLPNSRRPGRTPTLGSVAAADLDELRHLAVGQPAPAIEGEDATGRVMRLADYRGKVVVLTFWGSWCGSCMAQVPHEKALVERMNGRPFVLLGVNSDDDRARVEATARRAGITWRSWFDGGMVGGPIARRWNVPYWPMVFVIDHRGVIRAREVNEDPFLDKLAADLVAEAERDAVKGPPAP